MKKYSEGKVNLSRSRSNTSFFTQKISLWENEPHEPQKLKKMLRKSPASNAWSAIFKNADLFKSYKIEKFSIFSWEHDNSPLDNFPRDKCPRTIPTEENCPKIIALGQFPPRIIDPLDRWSLDISHIELFRLR